jgi:hypothetical protein
MADDFIKGRGWRESPYAKRYLKSLGNTCVCLWQVVSVKPGYFVDVKVLGCDYLEDNETDDNKVMRVYEKLGTRNLTDKDCVAARGIELDGRHQFGGAILPFRPEQSGYFLILFNELLTQSHQFKANEDKINQGVGELASQRSFNKVRK